MKPCLMCGATTGPMVTMMAEHPRTNYIEYARLQRVGPICRVHAEAGSGANDWVKLGEFLEALLRQWELDKNFFASPQAGKWRFIEAPAETNGKAPVSVARTIPAAKPKRVRTPEQIASDHARMAAMRARKGHPAHEAAAG